MIEFLSGALVLAFAVAGLHFLNFWRVTRDRLFLHFACAFWLFALNEMIVSVPLKRVTDQISGYEYVLRVLGFELILIAIAEKNLSAPSVSGQSTRHAWSICGVTVLCRPGRSRQLLSPQSNAC